LGKLKGSIEDALSGVTFAMGQILQHGLRLLRGIDLFDDPLKYEWNTVGRLNDLSMIQSNECLGLARFSDQFLQKLLRFGKRHGEYVNRPCVGGSISRGY